MATIRRIDVWYDRYTKSWCVQRKDAEGNEVEGGTSWHGRLEHAVAVVDRERPIWRTALTTDTETLSVHWYTRDGRQKRVDVWQRPLWMKSLVSERAS